MSLTEDLYREIILEHFKNPRNHGRLERPDLKAEGANPFCGDELVLTIALDRETVRDVRAECKGCSISQASCSMMTEAVKGRPLKEAEELAARFKGMMLGAGGSPADWPPVLEDLLSLEGVKKYPVRIKCAILSWNTLLEGIEAHRRGQSQARHVEGEEGAHPELAAKLSAEPGPASPAGSPPSDQPAGEEPEEQVRQALKGVIDPELNMNVVDLGLIYGVEVQERSVKVTYTLTSPGCPLGPVIHGQIQSALSHLPWVKEVHAQLSWTPPWDPHTMASEEAKTDLGIW